MTQMSSAWIFRATCSVWETSQRGTYELFKVFAKTLIQSDTEYLHLYWAWHLNVPIDTAGSDRFSFKAAFFSPTSLFVGISTQRRLTHPNAVLHHLYFGTTVFFHSKTKCHFSKEKLLWFIRCLCLILFSEYQCNCIELYCIMVSYECVVLFTLFFLILWCVRTFYHHPGCLGSWYVMVRLKNM